MSSVSTCDWYDCTGEAVVCSLCVLIGVLGSAEGTGDILPIPLMVLAFTCGEVAVAPAGAPGGAMEAAGAEVIGRLSACGGPLAEGLAAASASGERWLYTVGVGDTAAANFTARSSTCFCGCVGEVQRNTNRRQLRHG